MRRLARAGQYTSQARERRGAVTRFVEPAWSDVQFASPICVLSIQVVSTSNYGGAAGLVSAISPLRHVQMKHRGVGGEITSEDESRGLMLSANAPPSCPGYHTGLFVALAWLAGYPLAIPVAIPLAISWAFPALYSITWLGRRPARLALTRLLPRTRTLDLSRGLAGAASL